MKLSSIQNSFALHFLAFFTLVACGIGFTPILTAQTTQGQIVGTVTDTTGGVIPGITVTVTNTGTSDSRSVLTDDVGAYRVIGLIPGNYRLEVETPGFRRFVREPIVLQIESVVQIDVKMQLGDISDTVEVTAQTPLMETRQTSLSQVVEGTTVEEMPLNGRNVLNLVALASDVVPQGGAMGNTVQSNNFTWGNYAIGGGQANQTGSYLDGAPMNVSYANLTALVPSQESIAEFRVQTNNLSAEYGRFSGGVINLSTKGGTNEFHGNAFEFFRNKVLNASSWTANRQGQPRDPWAQNQFGGSLTGPIVRDKAFFMFTYEGLRLRTGTPYLGTVPLPEMWNGDFSDARNPNGTLAVIYDPLTTCGRYGNPACETDANGNEIITREPFPDNMIPPERINQTAWNLARMTTPDPNAPGLSLNNTENFVSTTTRGGDSDQYNVRIDMNVSDKQRIFGRFTQWDNNVPGSDTLGVGIFTNELNKSQNVVFADTYTFSPTMVGDFRISFMRYLYDRDCPGTPWDLTAIGFPAWMDDFIPEYLKILPGIGTGYSGAGQAIISGKNYTYSIAPSMTWIKGNHQMKFGAELRKLDFNFYQVPSSSGNYSFSNLITSADPYNYVVDGAETGFTFASALLGMGSGGSLGTAHPIAASMPYIGAYFNDTFRATRKLTLNLGIRWEVPGAWKEKYDSLIVFNPTGTNPLVPEYKGRYDLVNSPEYPSRYATSMDWSLFAPRVGAAYQVRDNLVVRAGYGIFFVPADSHIQFSPSTHPNNVYQNQWVASVDGGLTATNLISDPFPDGLSPAPSRSPTFQRELLGVNVTAGPAVPGEPYGYNQQWNLNIQYEFTQGSVVEIGYAGSRGVHLPWRGYMNAITPENMALGAAVLYKQVENPFYGTALYGSLAQPTIQYGQTLRPFPQYEQVANSKYGSGYSSYNALNARLRQRFQDGGVLTLSYTWAKNLGIVDTASNWLEGSIGGVGDYQNFYDIPSEYSLASFDMKQRFVASYVLELPLGQGKRFLSGTTGVLSKLVSGWGINGIFSLQTGFPLKMGVRRNNTYSYGSRGARPNVVEGCDANISGSAQSKLDKWFNTACYVDPAPGTFGNAPRVEPNNRMHGVNNWDLSLTKDTAITESLDLQFRAELFNLFNRVQFGPPNAQVGNANYGRVTSQNNQPRIAQFALKLIF